MLCSAVGYNSVDESLEIFKGSHWGADISVVSDAVATDVDASALGVVLLGEDFIDYLGVCDFFVSLCRGVLVLGDMEGISELHTLVLPIWDGADPLAEATQISGVGLVPGALVLRVVVQLVVFQGLS